MAGRSEFYGWRRKGLEECGLAVEGGENEVGGVGHVAGDEDDALEAGEAVTAHEGAEHEQEGGGADEGGEVNEGEVLDAQGHASGADADDEEDVEDAGAEYVAQGEGRLFLDSGDERGGQVGDAGTDADDAEADESFGHSPCACEGGGAFHHPLSAEDEQCESAHDHGNGQG